MPVWEEQTSRYNAPDPRPDYYRNLPSYYNNDPYQQQQIAALWQNDENVRQIDWQHLYDVNRASFETIRNADGISGNTVSGRRSRYIVEERVTNTKRFNMNMVYNTKIGEHFDFSAGASMQNQINNYYKKVNDLLGGEFYVDLNQFAERDFPLNPSANQNNLNRPNGILHEGDRFGYDYDIHIQRVATWVQGV
ncbi:MAG: TonB-dependent receptor, partial [Chitinophagaceae bacterium]